MQYIKAFFTIAILLVMVQIEPAYINDVMALIFLGSFLILLWKSD